MSAQVGFGDFSEKSAGHVQQKQVVTKKVVKNAKSTYDIEKNHLNLIEIKRRSNFKRIQPKRKFEHCEMLHQLDQTRQNVKKYVATNKIKEEDDKVAEIPFAPSIDKTSGAIMRNVNKDVLERTYDWMNMKLRKNTEAKKDKSYKNDEDLKATTMKHKPIPKSATATSKVRIFLETEQNNLNLTNSFKGTGGINNQNAIGVIQYTGYQGQPMKSKKKAVHSFLDPITTKSGAKSTKGKNVLHNVANQDKAKLGEMIGFYQGGNKPVSMAVNDPRGLKMKEFKGAISKHLRDMI